MDFGDKLKQYRLKEGLSQEQLAEKIGVSRQAITKWETKRGLPDVENMIILAELFNLTLDELVLEEVNKLLLIMFLVCQQPFCNSNGQYRIICEGKLLVDAKFLILL